MVEEKNKSQFIIIFLNWNGAHLKDEKRKDLEIPELRVVTTGMREWGINFELVDREGWRRKIKLKL